MLNPEVADALIGIGQRQVAAFRVGEGCAVEVELRACFLTPINPALEILYGHFVAINHFTLEISVNLMEIQAVSAWNEALSLEDVAAQLVDVPSLTRIVACTLDATG